LLLLVQKALFLRLLVDGIHLGGVRRLAFLLAAAALADANEDDEQHQADRDEHGD